MKSDHLPIVISLSADIKKTRAKKQTFVNFDKANWEGFKDYTEEIFANARPIGEEDKDIHEAEKFFRKPSKKLPVNTFQQAESRKSSMLYSKMLQIKLKREIILENKTLTILVSLN